MEHISEQQAFMARSVLDHQKLLEAMRPVGMGLPRVGPCLRTFSRRYHQPRILRRPQPF